MIRLIRKLEALERAPWKERFRAFFFYCLFLIIIIHVLHLVVGTFEGTLAYETAIFFGREYTGLAAILVGFLMTPLMAAILAVIIATGLFLFRPFHRRKRKSLTNRRWQ